MSLDDIPDTPEEVLSECLIWKWSKDYNDNDVERALSRLLDEKPDLRVFIEDHMEAWRPDSEQVDGFDIQWRKYRNGVFVPDLLSNFDAEQLYKDAHRKYYKVRAERYD